MNLEQLQKTQKSLTISINNDEIRKKQLLDEIIVIEKNKKEKGFELEKLSNEFDNLLNKIKDEKEKLSQLEFDINNKTNKNFLLEEELADLDNRVCGQKEKIEKDLKENIEKINQRMAMSNNEILLKREKLDKIILEIKDNTLNNEDLKKIKDNLEKEIYLLKEIINGEDKKIVSLKEEQKNISEAVGGYKSQIEEHKKNIEEKNNEISVLFKEVEQIKKDKKDIIVEQEEETQKLNSMKAYRFQLAKKGKELRKLFDFLGNYYKEANIEMPKVNWDITIPEFEDLDKDNIPKNN